MIGYLKGQPQVLDGETLLLRVGGVGYEVVCTPSTLVAVEGLAEAEVWIYTHVREDALQLFGFATIKEKQMFLSLIKVNGVGPKSALHIVGASDFDRLVGLINAGDAKGLSHLPKVGKKTAEQIILTLKGKLVFADQREQSSEPSHRAEIVSALVNLGFRLNDVEKVVERMPPEITLEAGVREGLVALTN